MCTNSEGMENAFFLLRDFRAIKKAAKMQPFLSSFTLRAHAYRLTINIELQRIFQFAAIDCENNFVVLVY